MNTQNLFREILRDSKAFKKREEFLECEIDMLFELLKDGNIDSTQLIRALAFARELEF